MNKFQKLRMNMFHFLSVFLLATMELSAKESSIEVGKVQWKRDYVEVLKESQLSGKPVFILFQEVPGCSGCKAFGRTVLSDPLLVEAIESEFIPLLIYNNRSGGMDESIRKKFKEPAWNYQVVRFLDSNGVDLIERKDQVWDIAGISSRMIQALNTANRPTPKYLQAIALESDTKNHLQSAFAMYCFWTGEMRLGQLDGVIATEAGWMNGREVVKVTYHKNLTDFQKLKTAAESLECADTSYVKVKDYRQAKVSDQKKQIQRWNALRKVSHITMMQQTKINAFASHKGNAALKWLSPRQQLDLKNQ